MKVKTTSMKKRLLALVTILAMLLTATASFMPVAAAPSPWAPEVVFGRILTPDQTGDIVNWVEIAQYNGSSLIVRASYLNFIGRQYYGIPQNQYMVYGVNNNYKTSVIRDRINHWFAGVADYVDWEDVLPLDARLRDFSLQHNAMDVLGTRYTPTTQTDGISLPTKYQVGIGADVAFALSYSEVAAYLSTVRNWKGIEIPDCYSSQEAIYNFNNISIPDKTPTNRYGMWLRTPGAVSMSAGALLEDGYAHELSVPYQTANNLGYGLVYPALWVNSGIFPPVNYTVTYYPNGGVGAIAEFDAAPGSDHTVTDQGYTNAGFTFLGWNTEANGTGAAYDNDDIITVTDNVKLYAQWGRTSSIVYHSNTDPDETYVDYGDNGTFTIMNNLFVNPPYKFKEWNTSPIGGGAILPPGLQFSNFSGTLHLYAQWYIDTVN